VNWVNYAEWTFRLQKKMRMIFRIAEEILAYEIGFYQVHWVK